MKKIIAFSATLLLGIGVFAGLGKVNAKQVSAATESGTAVAALLRGTIGENGYTKKTQIFLKTEAVEDIQTHFHASVPSLKRTTYYNHAETMLLMGDYDGGFASINSGYKNDGEGNATHFVYSGTAVDTSDLFTNHTDGWKAQGQTVGGYYETLSTLATVSENAEWETFTTSGYTVHKYNIDSLTINDGAYDNPVLNAYQYFAAPMLLRDNYISYNSIWVTQAASFLSIRLYASKTDAGKSTVTPGDNDVLISEARVYNKVSFVPEAKWFVKGDFNEWGEGNQLVYAFDAYNPEQYSLSNLAITKNQAFKLNDGADLWYGYSDNIVDNSWFGDAGENNNIKSNMTGVVTLWWKPGEHSLYIAASEVEVTISVTKDAGNGNGIFVVGTFNEDWNCHQAYRLNWTEGNVWTGSVRFPVGTDFEYKLVKGAYDAEGAGPTEWEGGSNRNANISNGSTSLVWNLNWQ